MEMDDHTFYNTTQTALDSVILFISKLDSLINLSDSKDFVKNGSKLSELSNLVDSKIKETMDISFKK